MSQIKNGTFQVLSILRYLPGSHNFHTCNANVSIFFSSSNQNRFAMHIGFETIQFVSANYIDPTLFI